MYRPWRASFWKSTAPANRVLFDGVRSAEPPRISGSFGIRASSTLPEASRVAIGLPGSNFGRISSSLTGSRPSAASRELLGQIGILLGVPLEQIVPLVLELGPLLDGLAHVVEDFLGNVEVLVRVPAELLLRQPDLLLAERRAVGLGGVLHVRAAVGDVRAELDHRGPPHLALGVDQGPLEPSSCRCRRRRPSGRTSRRPGNAWPGLR